MSKIGEEVAGNIMMVVESEQIDIVVLSTHGISGWRPLVFRSTAKKVVRLVQCLLMLLRSVESAATVAVSYPEKFPIVGTVTCEEES